MVNNVKEATKRISVTDAIIITVFDFFVSHSIFMNRIIAIPYSFLEKLNEKLAAGDLRLLMTWKTSR